MASSRVSLAMRRHGNWNVSAAIPLSTSIQLGRCAAGFLLLLGSPFLFGYAKPVPVNFRALRNPRSGMVWVAAAGPAMNIALAILAALAFHLVGYLPVTAAQWAAESAQPQPEPDAGIEAKAVLYLDRLETDVIGILQHRDDAAAAESDIELARQSIKRAVVEDVEVPLARIRTGVEQLLWIDAVLSASRSRCGCCRHRTRASRDRGPGSLRPR